MDPHVARPLASAPSALLSARRVAIDPKHIANAAEARALYLDNMRPDQSTADWRYAKFLARKVVINALRASDRLRDIEGALLKSGVHMLAFRHMLAPPMSQDQFKLVCGPWVKGSEDRDGPLEREIAAAVAAAVQQRIDRSLAVLAQGDRRGIEGILRGTSTLIAVQKVATARRSRIAFEQEYAVVELLENDGWTKLPSKLIDTRAAVPPMSFMRKTRFATKTTAPQEVDIACGLKNSYVLAMECKVTNDETNSVKRVNDVLKKASAWKDHWGSFVITAALLQGVVAPKDVQRLADAGVYVFWSHKLNDFRTWISGQMA